MIEQKIADWYHDAGITLTDHELYEVRLNCIKEFVKQHNNERLWGELVKNFMGEPIVINEIRPLIDAVNENDRSFTSKSENEARVLSGMCSLKFMEEYGLYIIGIMMKLLFLSGCTPAIPEIFQICMESLDNARVSMRHKECIEKDMPLEMIKLTEEQQESWENDTAEEFINVINNLTQHVNEQNRNIKKLNIMLKIQSEESDILWWRTAKWSELNDKKLSDMNDCQAAVAIPLEVMGKVSMELGPVSVFAIMKSALEERVLDKKYSLKEYINNASAKILEYIARYKAENLQSFTPILAAFHTNKNYDEIWCGVFQKDYGIDPENAEYSIGEITERLYLECEFCRNLQ